MSEGNLWLDPDQKSPVTVMVRAMMEVILAPEKLDELFEQTGVVRYEGQELHCRRVVVQLDRPTRDGETEIALLTNLPETDAPSVLVAHLYRSRWRVETLFQVATETFHCEIKTLGYPRAALFSFCMALVAYNLFSTLKGVLALCSW
ncbi:MAG: transposase [Pleurocapsa sp. MO_192.B19]|nr:transposase [Pleurocapsa sp. MO_192.B19]